MIKWIHAHFEKKAQRLQQENLEKQQQFDDNIERHLHEFGYITPDAPLFWFTAYKQDTRISDEAYKTETEFAVLSQHFRIEFRRVKNILEIVYQSEQAGKSSVVESVDLFLPRALRCKLRDYARADIEIRWSSRVYIELPCLPANYSPYRNSKKVRMATEAYAANCLSILREICDTSERLARDEQAHSALQHDTAKQQRHANELESLRQEVQRLSSELASLHAQPVRSKSEEVIIETLDIAS